MTRARDLADGADKDIAGTLTLDDIVLSNDMSVADNGKVIFGAGSDLEIFSTGTDVNIRNGNATSEIRIQSDDRIVLTDRGFNEIFAVFNDDSDVKLYHNQFERLATTSSGIDVTGTVAAETSSTGEFNAFTIHQATNSSGDEARIQFKRTTDGGSDREVAAIVADRVGGNDTALVFETNTDGSDGATERVRIDHDGKVGIGTSSPASLLSVQGDGLSFRLDGTGNTSRGIMIRSTGTAEGQIQTDGNMHFIQEDAGRVMKFSTANTERMRIDSSGRVLAGVTSSMGNGRLQVDATTDFVYCQVMRANASNAGFVLFQKDDGSTIGSIDHNASNTRYLTTSDHRLKESVVDMTGAIARVKQLSPKRYNFISDPNDTTVDGFLAHEAQTVVPNAVSGTHNEVDADGNAVMQGIDHSALVPLLTGALKEAIAKIETLETKVAALEAAE